MKVWNIFHTIFPDKDLDEKDKNYVGDEDERMEIYFYERNRLKTFATYVFTALTACLLELLFYWRPHWRLFWTYTKCEPIKANSVLLIVRINFFDTLIINDFDFKDKYDQIFAEKVVLLNGVNYVIPDSNGVFKNTESLKFFMNKKIKYLWNEQTLRFEKLYGLDRDILCSAFVRQTGLSDEQQIQRIKLFGENKIEIKVHSFLHILIHEVFSPFYMFQIMAIVLWSLEEYYYYSAFILFMSITSIISSAFQLRRNQRQLREKVGGKDIVEVWKSGDIYRTQETNHLAPGDVVVLPSNGFEMSCDVVLVNGNAIVDESMLTGESVPVIKSAITSSDDAFNRKHHFKHIIFSGTKVIQTRFYGQEKVKAVVIRTGFQTAKGGLVHSILFPKPIDFKFNRHINHFIYIMVVIAMFGLVYTFVIKAERDDNFWSIVIKALDLITIVVPPELPMAMTIASIFADKRLRQNLIYCMSPRSINMAGCVDCIVFDKTGTLTEDELSLVEVLPTNLVSNQFEEPVTRVDKVDMSPLLVCLASCHSLTILDNNIIGDPLDIKMFESTKWVLEEPEVGDTNKFDLLAPTIVKPPYVKTETDKPQVGILKQFPFSSNMSRMSVITRLLDAKGFEVYVKGAPEVIATLCDPNSMPKDFDEKLLRYTEKSYRVLALAFRPLLKMGYAKVQRIQREELEKELTFLGLVVMKNNLKDKTIETIDDLHRANIRALMATGDNLMTAICVAQECHLIDKNDSIVLIDNCTDSQGRPQLVSKYRQTTNKLNEFSEEILNNCLHLSMEKTSHLALTGNTFKTIEKYFPDLLPKIIVCGTVFARMSPEDKQRLIELLQRYGYIVSMTGDGANDVGALKASNCGISLSDTEASVASPFTSKTPNISCVTVLLREGRASLVSVFGVIKYMACYNLITFTATVILYSYRSNLTDIENLYQDLFVISIYLILFGRTEPYGKLSPLAPPTSLISLTQLTSIITHMLLAGVSQMVALFLLFQQDWYKEHDPEDELDYQSHVNYAIFSIQIFQYIFLAVVFSKGRPYRKPFYTNKLFLMAIIVTTVMTLYIVMAPEEPKDWISGLFEIETNGFSYGFRGVLMAINVCHFVLAFILEELIIGRLLAQKLFCFSKEKSYKTIAKQCSDSNWFEN